MTTNLDDISPASGRRLMRLSRRRTLVALEHEPTPAPGVVALGVFLDGEFLDVLDELVDKVRRERPPPLSARDLARELYGRVYLVHGRWSMVR